MKKTLLLFTSLFILTSTFCQDYGDIIWESTIDFETTLPYIHLDSSETNIWEIGTPSKLFFDSAYSPNTAIITDSLNFYPTNNHSFFDLLIVESADYPQYPYNVFIEIKHKFDTDSGLDGGYITRSNDGGETWVNIATDYDCYDVTPAYDYGWGSENLYNSQDTLFNGEPGFSGNSTDWVSTWFTWHILPIFAKKQECMGDSLIVRFNFVSDDIKGNFEGWMIDDLKVYAVDLGSSIDEIENTLFSIAPNPSQGQFLIEFKGNFSSASLEIYNATAQQILKETTIHRNHRLDLTEYSKGLYFVVITDEKGNRFTERVVLE